MDEIEEQFSKKEIKKISGEPNLKNAQKLVEEVQVWVEGNMDTQEWSWPLSTVSRWQVHRLQPPKPWTSTSVWASS